uniref:OCRE domain-containing protein n=1 Tax=Sinocyclocheilus grahami TaxID=75366 RepID=A0A672PAM9_SINGR
MSSTPGALWRHRKAGSDAEITSRTLRRELKTRKDELQKLQKQLSQSERLQKMTESYNEELRQQVDKLSAEIHERKKREREKMDAETQTEECTWTETDHCSYYYGGYYQSGTETTAEAQENVVMETQGYCEPTEEHHITAETAPANPELPNESSDFPQTEEASGEGGSIADMLRATAEEAVNQTNFVFDESSGMYYDHSTGFYYDSSSQLYYDANTGMYYYYDPESGKYQFHSRIEVPTAHPEVEQTPQRKTKDWKNRKWVKNTDRASCPDGGDHKEAGPEIVRESENHQRGKKDESSSRKKGRESLSQSPQQRPSTKERSRQTKSRDGSRDRSANRKKTQRRSESHSDDSHSKSRREKGSNSDDTHSRKKKRKEKKRSCSETRRERKSRSDNVSGESEPEAGEITESDGEKELSSASSSYSSSSASPVQPEHDSPESEMEKQMQESWPPCVRVTVVCSPVLQTGTLFILTADTVATIGRSVQLYEVKMGETVLSFHIHMGTDTWDGCEPGQTIAHLSRHKKDDSSGTVLSKEDKELQRQKELKMMKVKYGLKVSFYVLAPLTLHAYRTRAHLNRALTHLFQPSQGQLNECTERSH